MKYIRGFDGLRAISILFVLLTHLGLTDLLIADTFLKKNYNLISGTTGVMIFFSISGFLITNLLLSEKEKYGHINLKFFFIRRFLRLLPPLVVFFFILTGLMFFNLIPRSFVALTFSFFYLYNFVPHKFYITELGHTWSLGVEEQFYLIWPFIIRGGKKFRKGLFFSILIIVLCLIWKYVFTHSLNLGDTISYLESHFHVNRWFIPACLPIMIGSLSSILLFKYKLRAAGIFEGKQMVPFLSLFLFFIQLIIPGISSNWIDLLQPIGISILLLWIYHNQASLLVKILEFKPISFLGKISYGVYVYQGLFLGTGPGGSLGIQKFPLNIILVFVTAVISYYFIEKKVMKYKNQFKP